MCFILSMYEFLKTFPNSVFRLEFTSLNYLYFCLRIILRIKYQLELVIEQQNVIMLACRFTTFVHLYFLVRENQENYIKN